MNHKIGIIATSLIVCAMAGPARAELSGAAVEAGTAPSADNGGASNPVSLVLAKYAVDGQSMISAPISEISSIVAITKTNGPMNAYYSVTGSDNQQVIAANSAAPAYFTITATGAGQAAEAASAPGPGLAALVQWGVPVGSGAMVSGESVAPLSGASSSPIETPLVIMNQSSGNTSQKATPVPIPLPFFLTGSGLAALLAFKRRGGKPIHDFLRATS